jgi:hypothetical protein
MASAIDPTKPVDGIPAVKAELRDNLQAAKDEIEALQSSKKQDGDPYDMADALLTRADLKDYAETSTTPAIAGGGVTLDLESGNVFEVTLTEDVTDLAFTNPPVAGKAGSLTLILRQDAAGGRAVAWPGVVRWSGGLPPTVSGAADAVDIYAFVTRDGGATWYGFRGGQDFS